MDPSDHEVPPRGRRLQFSLATLILFVTIVALLVALWTTSQRWKKDAAELKRLRALVGELTISDPDKVHAIRVPTTGELKWQWRVYLPEGREFVLRLITGEVPRTGVPAHAYGVRSYLDRSGEFLLSANVEKDRRGTWVLAGSAPRWNFSHPLQNDEWARGGGWSFSEIELGKTISVEPGTPLVLVCVRVDEGGRTPEGPCDGLMIVIEEVNSK